MSRLKKMYKGMVCQLGTFTRTTVNMFRMLVLHGGCFMKVSLSI